MKKLNVLLTAALLSSAVHAQLNTNTATPAAGASAMVNPFVGKPLSIEELQSELETARLRTAALEEQLKQTSLTSEIATVPLRKAAEAAQARVAMRGEELKLETVEKTAREAAAAEKAEQKSARAARARAAKNPVPTARANEAVASVPTPVPRPSLLSVLTIGTSKTAVLDFGGNTLMVEDGGMTPLGPVKVVDDRSVSIAGGTLRVSTVTLSRFVQEAVPEGVPEGVPSVGAGTLSPAARPAGVSGGATGGQGVNIATEGTAGATGEGAGARLPPLQLPPGMTILPASNR